MQFQNEVVKKDSLDKLGYLENLFILLGSSCSVGRGRIGPFATFIQLQQIVGNELEKETKVSTIGDIL
jgi:hypothetical protein